MKIPFRLDEGIYFEDSGQVIRWTESLDIIKNIDNPEIAADGTVLKWLGKICFNGQKVNVTVIKDRYYNTDGQFAFVSFEQVENDVWGFYKKYSEYFKTLFGTPIEFKYDEHDRPTELWNIGDVQILLGIGERFTEFEIFSIHKGQIFWTLKNKKQE